MASVFCVFVFPACFLFLHVSCGREHVVANKEKLASSFKVREQSKSRIEAVAYTFQDADAISMRRRRNRFVLEDTNEGKDLAADQKTEEPKETMKAMSEIPESSGSKPPERSSVGTNNNDRSPTASVLWRVPKKKALRSEKFPGFDSDYCLPRTHPPSHN